MQRVISTSEGECQGEDKENGGVMGVGDGVTRGAGKGVTTDEEG